MEHRPGHQRYGLVLLLILFTIGFELAAPEDDTTRVITVIAQGLTLLAALRASRVSEVWVRAAAVVVVLTLLGTLGLISLSDDPESASRILSLLLAAGAPIAIAFGIARGLREAGMVTVQTMFGVLCIYLLVGLIFSLLLSVAASFSDQTFLNGATNPDSADFLYFSFVTLTTTGYGDITPATNLGRSLAITEALVGQIYLVTVVALIVTNIGRPRPKR